MSRVKALYDFSGEPNTPELTIVTGDVLTITRTDVGDGWWEGTNGNGQTGLFPAAYVEVMPMGPPKVAVPPPPPMQSAPPPSQAAPRYDQTADEYAETQDDWDDDWDEDGETYSEIGPGATAAATGGGRMATNSNNNNNYQQQASYPSLPPTPSYGGEDTMSLASSNAPVKSRSKMFAKSDNYFMGIAQAVVPETDRVIIIADTTGFAWKSDRRPYSVTVDSPKKETKFKGIKSFIAYQLTPSFNNVSVFRRYKHFDWLHERLAEKFSMIPIPPLPEKQISGRYEEQFIENRRVQLQEFVDWVCRHPVLSYCEVWMHFLVCQDEKKWKVGKRTAEKDPLLGSMYCAAIFPPEKQLLPSQVDGPMDLSNAFLHSMDGAIKTLYTISGEQMKRYQTTRKDFQRIGEGFSELAKALEVDERRATTSLSLANSVGQAAGVYIAIGQLYADQPKNDWMPLSNRLHIYKGVLGSFPYIMAEQKNAVAHRKDSERQTHEQKMSNAQLQEVIRRTDVMNYAVMAEMTHFRAERDTHLKATLREFISNQITFYQNIISRLQVAQHFFD